LPEQNIYNLY